MSGGGGDLGKVDGELLARPVHEHLVPRHCLGQRSARRAGEPLPARYLLGGVAGPRKQDELVPGQAQKGTGGRAERRVRLLERSRAHELGRGGSPEGLRDVEQATRLLCAAALCLLGAPSLGVLEGEAGMIGQTPRQYERLRPIRRCLGRPDHAQHPPDVSRDHDRDLERVAATDEPERGVRVAWPLRRRGLREDGCLPGERLLEAGDLAPRATGPWWVTDVGRLLMHQYRLVPGEGPELGELAVERGERLAADGLHDRFRALARETRREPRDPVEAFTQGPFAVVQLRPLECLSAERGRELRQGHELRVYAAGRVEREAHRADDPLLCEERDGKRAVRVDGESRSIRELALEVLARVCERGSAGPCGLRDRRQGVERDAESGRQGGATHTAWVDDHELLSLHQTEGAAHGPEERWQALDERVRHLVRCRGGGKLGGKRSESVPLGFDLAGARHG